MFDPIPHLEPLWPLLAIGLAAAVLIGLTYWTYKGVQTARGGRREVLLLLRLLALGSACLVLLRPTWEYREVLRQPALLVLLVDATKSMLVHDEVGQSRWEAANKDWRAAADLLKSLEQDEMVQVIVYQFDNKLGELRWSEPPTGDRTAIMAMLDQVFEHHKPFDRDKSTPLLGVVLLSDGRDNVGKPSQEAVASKFARGPVPIHIVAFGHPGGSELQPDLIAQSVDAPPVARIKDKMTVRGAIQSQQFVNQEIEVWLLIDGKPVKEADNPTKDVRLTLRPDRTTQTMPVEMPACKLPDTPGEIKVSLRVTPLPGELTETNNEVSTYVTLTKEGLSVLYLEGKFRPWEPKFLSRALKEDERITLYTAQLFHDRGAEAELARQELRAALDKTSYDVFIIGDVPASRFDPDLLSRIEKTVAERGAGLVMIGGHESFGDGGWQGTPVAGALPVTLNARGQLEGPEGKREIRFLPTDEGLRHFALRLDSDPARNRDWWTRLHPLNGGNVLGQRKNLASELATSDKGELLLAVQEYGKGRSAALAVDTTWRWSRLGPPRDPRDANKPGALSEGQEAHLRFWRQLILWLARQEDAGKSLRIELDHRRLAVGKEQGIAVQARELTPGGSRDQQKPIRDAEFAVKVLNPRKAEVPVIVTSEGADGKSRGVYWQTDEPGEYEVTASARSQGADLGQARARFMAYRDDSELLNRAANHTLLEQLAALTGGSYRLHGGLRALLEQLKPETVTQTTKLYKVPNWDQPDLWPPLILFMVFMALISAEWLLRRVWGLI